jgi:hypothetical protein
MIMCPVWFGWTLSHDRSLELRERR